MCDTFGDTIQKKLEQIDSGHYTFYFIRHGFSCTNLLKKKPGKFILSYIPILGLYDDENTDPHLTNWGIAGSIRSGNEIRKIIFNEENDNKDNEDKDNIFDTIFVSPLIRTWETSYCLFPTMKNIIIAPHIREYTIILGKTVGYQKVSDSFYSKSENINRFKNFKKCLENYNENLLKKEKSISNNRITKMIKNNIENIKKNGIYSENIGINQFKKNRKIKIIDENKEDNSRGDLNKFIYWWIQKYGTNKKMGKKYLKMVQKYL